MRIEKAKPSISKGWYLGHWNSGLGISIGFANTGVDEPHSHKRITEIYLIARGTATMQVDRETITLNENDVIVIEPGEAHTFLSSSSNYSHFVVHIPGLKDEEARADKVLVARSSLGDAQKTC